MKKLVLKFVVWLIYNFDLQQNHIEWLIKKKVLTDKKANHFLLPILYENGVLMNTYVSYFRPVGILVDNLIVPIFLPPHDATYPQALIFCEKLRAGGVKWRMPTREDIEKVVLNSQTIKEIRRAFGVTEFTSERWIWLSSSKTSNCVNLFGVPPRGANDRQKIYPVANYR